MKLFQHTNIRRLEYLIEQGPGALVIINGETELTDKGPRTNRRHYHMTAEDIERARRTVENLLL